MPIKVSVVVPTFRTDPVRLRELVDSLTGQTLPSDEFEVLFVDDGSGDGTPDRLGRLCAGRPTWHVVELQNSGWACRPRNVGTDRARGDYVLYMDHDDLLYPEALQRGWAYGTENRADVVNWKETRTNAFVRGWDEYARNVPVAAPGDAHALMPMTPHKLYRREFLREHGVRFHEKARLLWEDVYFNVALCAAGARVSVLADYPCYHWVATGVNTSSGFGHDVDEKWQGVRRLYEFFDRELSGDLHDAMVFQWFRGRVLDFGGSRLAGYDPDRARQEFDSARRVAADFVPRGMDARLPAAHRARAVLLRRGDFDLARLLSEQDRGVAAACGPVRTFLHDGALHVRSELTLASGGGRPFPLTRRDGRILRDLPETLMEVLPSEALDITDDVPAGTAAVCLRGRTSRVGWAVPAAAGFRAEDGDGRVVLRASVDGRVDPRTAAGGRPLEDAQWDLGVRVSVCGYGFVRRLDRPGPGQYAALVDGRSCIVYSSRGGKATLDLDEGKHTLVGAARPAPDDFSVQRSAGGIVLEAGLPRVAVSGRARRTGVLVLEPTRGSVRAGVGRPEIEVPAVLDSDGRRARISATVHAGPGSYRIRTRFSDRTSGGSLYLRVRRVGAATVARTPVPSVTAALARRWRWLLRRTRVRR